MDPGADVREITALRDWLAALATYRSDAMNALAGVEMELRRGFDWIEQQGGLWARAVRDCEEQVVQAKAELAARKFENFDGKMPDTTVQERNLRRAEARLEHAQEQVVRCRKWMVRLPKQVDEAYTGAARRLAAILESDLPVGMADLDRRAAALEQYADLKLNAKSE
ncbi:MAG TPA: hypothetical protein VGJ05_00395 [Fimbriiglobus sp.]|jgi:hypothetical protein